MFGLYEKAYIQELYILLGHKGHDKSFRHEICLKSNLNFDHASVPCL